MITPYFFASVGAANIDAKDTFHAKHLKKMTKKQYIQNSYCRNNKDDLSAIELKLTLEDLKCSQQVRVEHEICSTMLGDLYKPFETIQI